MNIYNFLIQKLKDRKGHVPAIGHKVGISSTTIQSWITGGHMPPIDKAEKVLNALGYEIEIKQTKEVVESERICKV